MTYRQLFDHLEEQENQVYSLLSIRYAAQSSLMSSTTKFKANLMIANTQDQEESIKVVVDEIWNSYYLDMSGALDKEETRLFISELVPEMSSIF